MNSYSLPGFSMPIRNDQVQSNSTRPHHGLVLHVRSEFIVEKVIKYSSPLVEFIMADITSTKGHMQTVVLYKAPQCRLQDLKDVLVSKLLPTLDIGRSNIMIMGDFNLDILSGNDNFLKFMEDKFRCKTDCIKVTTNYGSALDLMLSRHIQMEILKQM